MSVVMFFLFSLQENLTFDCVSTFSSVVIFLFLNDVVTSPKKASLCFAPRVVKVNPDSVVVETINFWSYV
jgi:hypothetical protein